MAKDNLHAWDTTANNNTDLASIATGDNAMDPGQVDNFGRELMAQVKEAFLDLGGAVETAGAGNAYTATINAQIASYTDGLRVTVKADRANSGAATLNLNSKGAKAIRKRGDVALASGAIAVGDFLDLVYDTSLASAAGAFLWLNAPEPEPELLVICVSNETTSITTGTAKVTFRMPFAFTVSSVRASLSTASSSGVVTVDINDSGTTILSTKLTIDASEKTSTTAAAAAVISDTALADDAEITVDIDTAGTGAKGLKVYLAGTRG